MIPFKATMFVLGIFCPRVQRETVSIDPLFIQGTTKLRPPRLVFELQHAFCEAPPEASYVD